jgi:hypothetical protein
MSTVLDILEYDNFDRIWIECRETEVREGRRKVKKRFRSTHHPVAADGSAYEDTVEHLSESDRDHRPRVRPLWISRSRRRRNDAIHSA